MLKIYNNTNILKNFIKTKNYFLKYSNWHRLFELNKLLSLLTLNKKNINIYLNLPLNYNSTRTKKPVKHNLYFAIKLFKFINKYLNFKQIKLSKNYLKFDLINRLFFKIYKIEFLKIRFKRLKEKKLNRKNKNLVNFPILQYKYVIRNFKTVNKKKQKLLKHYNVGFFFYEYSFDKQNIKRFNKKILKRNINKLFILK